MDDPGLECFPTSYSPNSMLDFSSVPPRLKANTFLAIKFSLYSLSMKISEPEFWFDGAKPNIPSD